MKNVFSGIIELEKPIKVVGLSHVIHGHEFDVYVTKVRIIKGIIHSVCSTHDNWLLFIDIMEYSSKKVLIEKIKCLCKNG